MAHGQHRLGAVQRLDLGLLVGAGRHGRLGRFEVEPGDVAGSLEGCHQVRRAW
jgi:hypothetical protein